MAVLVFLLAAACLTCFGTAYYLFTTRWESHAINPRPAPTDQQTQVVPYNPDSDIPDGRFLAYLPHSGFHNQRIAFENALVLARLLNRTLLVPPIRLGDKPLRYVNFDALYQYHTLSGKYGLSHCSLVPTYVSLPPECLDYFDYTYIAWEWLVDLTEVKSRQPLFTRWNMSRVWVMDRLHIPDAETLMLRDTTPYHYRFLDTLADASPVSDKYMESIYLPMLAQSTKRLVHLGTLFGSSRLRLKNPDNIAIRGKIRRSMSFANPDLVRVADTIAESLGGQYLGAHVRLGDGRFKANRDINVRLIWWKLVHDVLGFSLGDTVDLERTWNVHDAQTGPPNMIADFRHRDSRYPSPPLPKANSTGVRCRGRLHSLPQHAALNMPLFISTDAVDPVTSQSLSALRETFPCTFFLSDFPGDIMLLDNLRNPHDGVLLGKFMRPFLDAMVVGKAWNVVGTETSTFSRFVQDVLWRTSHGWEIEQRG